jgi:DmsE family decaheme c-type cytochrome
MKSMTQFCVRVLFALNLLFGVAIGMTVATPAWAAQEPATDGPAAAALKQDAVCTGCHDENDNKPVLSIYQTKHGVRGDARTPTCQSCHGNSAKHVAGAKPGELPKGGPSRPAPEIIFKTSTAHFPATDAATQSEACATCHKGGKRVHWEGSQHQARGVPCAACHAVHTKADPVLSKATQPEACYACHKTERAQTHRVSTHPLAAGKMACSDCHNPHGTTGPKLLAKNSVNDTCTTCHAEKRGPFLWEHGPVADDCSTCHTPHGSSNAPLLKARAPVLCQQCHSGDHGAQINSGANLAGGNVTTVNGVNPLANAAARAQLAGRACLNCHVLVHGSNHPAGSKFQR